MAKVRIGNLPKVLGEVRPEFHEVGYCLYLPISIPGEGIILPENRPDLAPCIDIVRKVASDIGPYKTAASYIYLTFKRMIVGPSVTPNRPGWHCDGFGSNDLNFVWYDCVPTVFNSTEMEVPDDHVKSLEEMEAKINLANNMTYPEFNVLRLDPTCIHRVNDVTKEQMRTFVKISVSDNPYNLKGNSTNPQVKTNFKYYERALVRNDPARAQQDFYIPPKDDHFI